MISNPIKLLWTGGRDSTFRLLYILLVEKKSVQPCENCKPCRNAKETGNSHGLPETNFLMDLYIKSIFKVHHFVKVALKKLSRQFQ